MFARRGRSGCAASGSKHSGVHGEVFTRAEVTALATAAARAIGKSLSVRDPYTGGHQQRVARLAGQIARAMGGISDDDIAGLVLAAELHDVGKISVPTKILNKPGALSAPEFDLIRGHARTGYDIVCEIDFPWPIAEMVGQHHERMDGSGYPWGLAGDEIVLGARIIAVADVVDAMESDRPYRVAPGRERALAAIVEGRGAVFDADVVDAFLRIADQRVAA